MSSQIIQPIINEAALLIKKEKILVVADLHIGIEREFRELGLQTPSQTSAITARLISLIKKIDITDIILLGDIKHTIPTISIQERTDVRQLLETLQTHATIHILPGNHDGNIHKILLSDIILHKSDGIALHNIGFIHGHRWPKPELLQTNYLITAHTHPTVMLTDRLGYNTYESCWIRGKSNTETLQQKYPENSDPTIIIMPAYHPLCGGIAINKEPPIGPFGKLLNIPEAELFLLDGSSLGQTQHLNQTHNG